MTTGNRFLHQMTKGTRRRPLRVDLEDFENGTRYAEYAHFVIDSENDNFTLHVSGYSGNAGEWESPSGREGACFT